MTSANPVTAAAEGEGGMGAMAHFEPKHFLWCVTGGPVDRPTVLKFHG